MKNILVVALLSAAPASAQRVTTRVPAVNGTMPVVAPARMNSMLPASGLSLTTPSLAPALAAPSPALRAPALAAAAAPVAARPALAAAALAHSVPSAASAQTPDSAPSPESAVPLADLQNGARGEDGGGLAAGRLFDGNRPAPVASDPAGQVSPSQSRRRGTLTYWNEVRGYGFITPKDGSEGILVVANDIDRPTVDLKTLKEGEEVDYELRQTPNGPSAVKVIPVRLLPGGGGVLSRAVAGQNPGSERIFDGADMRRRFNGS